MLTDIIANMPLCPTTVLKDFSFGFLPPGPVCNSEIHVDGRQQLPTVTTMADGSKGRNENREHRNCPLHTLYSLDLTQNN